MPGTKATQAVRGLSGGSFSGLGAVGVTGTLVLIIVTFFFRGQWFGSGFSATYLLPMLSIWLLAIFVLRQIWFNGSVALPPASYGLLAMATAINLIVNAAAGFDHIREIGLFAGELTLNALLLLVGYNLARGGSASVDGVLRLIVLAGAIAAGVLVWTLTSMEAFSRLAFAATAVNHLGHALAILAMVSLYLMLEEGRRGSAVGAVGAGLVVIAALALLVITSTRSAIAGFLIALALVLVLRGGRREALAFLLVVAVAAVVVGGVVVRSPHFAFIVQRFDVDQLVFGLGSRLVQWRAVLEGATAWSVAFGSPWLYEAIASERRFFPHNIALSIYLYMGIVPLLIVAYIAITRVVDLWVYSRRMPHDLLPVMLLAIFVIAITYASMSGEFTRIFTIVFILGMIEGWRNAPVILRNR